MFKLLDRAVENLQNAGLGSHLGEVFFEMGYLLTDEPRSWLQPRGQHYAAAAGRNEVLRRRAVVRF